MPPGRPFARPVARGQRRRIDGFAHIPQLNGPVTNAVSLRDVLVSRPPRARASAAMSATTRRSEVPSLWELALAEIETGTHPLDQARTQACLRGLADVGETPPTAEVRAVARTLWPAEKYMVVMVCDTWRDLLRHPRRVPKLVRRHHFEPLYAVDLTCERHRLEPPEPRLRRRALAATDEFAVAASGDDPAQLLEARRRLDYAIRALDRMWRLRHPPDVTSRYWVPLGTPDDMRPRAPRPRWW